MKNRIINQEIEVNSFYFTQGRQFRSFPKEITLGTNRYAFRDGLQFMVQNGQKIVRLFTMTDGSTNYRLRNEKDHWVLLDMKAVVG
jgi:hypothetical protein